VAITPHPAAAAAATCLAKAGDLRCLRNVPSSSESLNQQHARVHAASQNIDVVSLILEGNRLSCEYLEIGIRAVSESAVPLCQTSLSTGSTEKQANRYILTSFSDIGALKAVQTNSKLQPKTFGPVVLYLICVEGK
jgi:hypothetical protein